MADWTAQYLAALTARDELEKADADIYDRCTRLADTNAELKAGLRKMRATSKTEITPASPVPAPLISYGFRRQASPQIFTENETLLQIRQEFVVAQQERADLQAQVASMKTDNDGLSGKLKHSNDQLARMQQMITKLSMKMKDREEELRGKARLLVDVQDENATLNLELNQAEKEVKKVKMENKDLVDRWVARMGKEAEKMNEDSKFS